MSPILWFLAGFMAGKEKSAESAESVADWGCVLILASVVLAAFIAAAVLHVLKQFAPGYLNHYREILAYTLGGVFGVLLFLRIWVERKRLKP